MSGIKINQLLKLIYSEKATKFCKISTVDLTVTAYDKSGDFAKRGTGCQTFDAFWVPDDIESCNFQNLLVFGFPETSQNPNKRQMSGIHI